MSSYLFRGNFNWRVDANCPGVNTYEYLFNTVQQPSLKDKPALEAAVKAVDGRYNLVTSLSILHESKFPPLVRKTLALSLIGKDQRERASAVHDLLAQRNAPEIQAILKDIVQHDDSESMRKRADAVLTAPAIPDKCPDPLSRESLWVHFEMPIFFRHSSQTKGHKGTF